MRDRLAPVLGVRQLLPLVEVRGRMQSLHPLNADDETTAQLLLEVNRFRDPARDHEGPLAARIRLLPVRGHQ